MAQLGQDAVDGVFGGGGRVLGDGGLGQRVVCPVHLVVLAGERGCVVSETWGISPVHLVVLTTEMDVWLVRHGESTRYTS